MSAPNDRQFYMDRARDELTRAGFFDTTPNVVYPGLGSMVLDLFDVWLRSALDEQTGNSAHVALSAFQRLATHKVLGPVTSNPDEWMKVDEDTWQSKRQASIFSKDGGQTWYDLDNPNRLIIQAEIAVVGFNSYEDEHTDHADDVVIPLMVTIEDGDIVAAERGVKSPLREELQWLPVQGYDSPLVTWLLAHHVSASGKGASVSTGGGGGVRYKRTDYGRVESDLEFKDIRWVAPIDKEALGTGLF